MLDFSHSELSYSEESLARRDLIPKAEADLCRGEGHATIVELNKTSEVDKDALGSLRTKVSL